MVSKLVTDARLSSCGQRIDQSDTLLVIHDVQGFALQRHDRSIAAKFAVNLEAAEVDAFLNTLSALVLGNLAYTLSVGVVDIIGGFGGSIVAYLLGRRL